MRKNLTLLRYIKANRDSLFGTQAEWKFIQPANQNIRCWRSTRLKFLRDGIEAVSNPNDLIVQYIRPQKPPYVEGFYILTLKELESVPSLQRIRGNEKSYLGKGWYHWPKPPQYADPFFIPLNSI